MMNNTIRLLITRDLRAMQRQLGLYPDDDAPWRQLDGVPNSAGTLALHVAGNLRHFIGATLGGTGYVRDRELEFARRGAPRAELLAEIDGAIEAVERAMAGLDEEGLRTDYPLLVGDRRVATGDFLLHLATHLAYHLGQVDYHRRTVTGDLSGVDAVSVREFAAGVGRL
jgi:uncharacterized damage-inducible protein DinB